MEKFEFDHTFVPCHDTILRKSLAEYYSITGTNMHKYVKAYANTILFPN